MKKIFTILIAVFIFSSVHSQKLEKENVPAPVIKQFESLFPKVKNSKWELDFENYQVDFTEGKVEKSVWFDKDGKWIKKTTILISSQLPATVKEVLIKSIGGSFSDYTYDYIEKIEAPNVENKYKIIIKKNKEPLDFLISEKGQILEKEDEEH